MLDILYTNTDAIRSALSIGAEDLDDSLMDQDYWIQELILNLGTWVPTHADIAAVNDSKAAYLRSYCTHWVAYRLLSNWPLLFPIVYSDGKSQQSRTAAIEALESIKVNIGGAVVTAKHGLQALLLGSDVPVASAISVVAPLTDPVTYAGA